MLTWDVFSDRTELGSGSRKLSTFHKTNFQNASRGMSEITFILWHTFLIVTVEDSWLFRRALKRIC